MKLKYILSVLLIVAGIKITNGRSFLNNESSVNPNSNTITLPLDFTHIPGIEALAPSLALPAITTNTSYQSFVDPATRSLNTSYLAGTMSGALNINQAGSTTYSIPIEVLPGVGGLAPSISLVYSSNSGFGTAGYGWQIGGISMMGRTGQNYYNDGAATGINLASSDKFLLDGQRLVATSGNYGADQTTYHTEEDIFSAIQSLGTLGSGPDKFISRTKSGFENQYGYNADAKQQIPGYSEVLNWYITQTSDVYGNLITYTYLKDNNRVYPSEINYGPNKIAFTYTTRTDVTSSYLKGQKIQQTLLLDKITVSYNSNTVRMYQMNYNLMSDNYNSYSVLNEVVEYGTGSNRLNSTVFSYQTPANVSVTQSNHYSNYDKISFNNLIYTGDFNGDGKTDLLSVANGGGSMSLISGAQPSSTGTQSTLSETQPSVVTPLAVGWTGMKMYFSDGNDNFTNSITSTNSIDTGKLDDLQILDINGDGKDDILYEINNSGYSTFYYMLNNNGTGFGSPVSFCGMTNGTNTGMNGKNRRKSNKQENDNQLSGVDFNGDGVNDIFINDASGNWKIYSFANSSGQLTSSLSQLKSGTIANLSGETLSGDYNGDGIAEIWSVESTGTKIYGISATGLNVLYTITQATSNHFFTLGDFNADGKTDLFIYGNISGGTEYDWSNWQLQLSNGASFEQVTIAQKKANLKNDYVRLGDFNGDGCTDVLVTSKNQSWTGTYIYITKSRGTDFYSYNISGYPNEALNYNVGDFNGDGRADYICTGTLSTSWSGYQVYKSTGNTTPLLEKVANGTNHLSTIAYTKLSQAGGSVYQQGAAPAFPVYNYQGGLPVVTTLTLDNGTGSSNSLTYYYEGAKMHRQGKGFLCFSKVTAADATAGIVNETLSGFSTTYFYPQLNSITKKTTGGAMIETTTNSWTQTEIDAPSKLIFPYVQTTGINNALTGFSVTTTTSYDDKGNPSYVAKNYSNGVTEGVQTVYVDVVRPYAWKPRVIDHTTVTYSKANETNVSKTIRYTYSTDGVTKPDVEYYYEGTPLAFTKDNDYDAKGNLIQTVTSGTSVGTSQVNYTYETNGVRVLTSTDALRHVTTNAYNAYGQLYTVTDYLSNVNTYGYDALGRQTSVSNTNGSQVTTSYVWTGTNKPTLGVYGVTQTGNDGSVATTWYDKLQRAIRSEKKGFGGTMILNDKEYNTKGQLYRVSDPYFAGGSQAWAETYSYDTYGRNDGITRNTGRNTTFGYNNATITETTGGKTFTKTYGPDGTLGTATDAGGTITYAYYPDGKTKSITAPNNVVTTMQYADAARNQTQLVDPSAGTINYTYDSFGRIKTQTDARSKTTTYTYLADGRTDNVVNPEGTSTYSYNANKQLTGISSPGSVSRTYGYDTKGRVTSIAENIAGSNFSVSFTYDTYGRLSTRTYPSNVVETLGYNSYGYLATISAGGSTRYTITSMNAREQLTGGTYGSNLTATYGFDTYGYPSSTATGSLQDYRYSFDATTGNLSSRQNYKRSLSESFSYTDGLDRLNSVTGPQNLTMTYTSNGNISTKSDIGTTFGYGTNAGPYALTSVSSSTNVIPTANQVATYTSFEKVNTLNEGTTTATFVYNADYQRARMDIVQGGSTIVTRWYAGGSYMKETVGAVTKEYTYLGGDAYTAPVVAITQSGLTNYYYLLRDYLGNITHQVNTSNAVVAEYNFDAWGRRRSADDWSYTLDANDLDLVADRGFTGHEFLKWFNVYNMNGRLYDPLVGRFMNVDPFVQNSSNTQNLNRYSYCLNNPLRYTDPSGMKMLAANEGWEVDSYFSWMCDVTKFGHSLSDAGGDGASYGGWGGNGGALPGWYTSASNFGKQLYNTANGTLGRISEDEVYSLTNINYVNGAFEFTFGRNEVQTQYTKQLASYLERNAIWAEQNIGYGKSFHGDGNGETFKRVVEATGLGADALNTPIGITKAVLQESGKALEGFTKAGTVIGAIAGGGPAIYNIVTKRGGNWKDWAALSLSVAGVASEFFGVGEIWDSVAIPVTVGVTVGTVGFDVYNIIDENKHK